MEQVTTKVIARQNGMTLVEWVVSNDTHRAWVTPDMIVDESGRSATVTHPAGGIPYGVDWSALVATSINADEVARAFRRAGVWTVEDLQRQPNVALGVLRALASDLLQPLLVNARAYQKDARLEG